MILIEGLDEDDTGNITADLKWKLIDRFLPNCDIDATNARTRNEHVITINEPTTPTEINNTIKQINAILHMKPKELRAMLLNHTVRSLHYIATYGDYGCLPAGCHSFKERKDAIKWLIETLDLPPFGNRADGLQIHGYTDLGRFEYSVDYAEITKCNCDNQEVHNDD